MGDNNRFFEVFKNKPVLGMLHLGGGDEDESVVDQAVKEAKVYADEGIDGVIVENYISRSIYDVEKTLIALKKAELNLIVGVNILPNEYALALEWADAYGAKFIQLDYVSGEYTAGKPVRHADFMKHRELHPDVLVLGGVWPKYYTPKVKEPGALNAAIEVAKVRADAIVVTGSGTGMETSHEKIKLYRHLVRDFPLVGGSGFNVKNIYEGLTFLDAVIVGSDFKTDGKASNHVASHRVKEFMAEVFRLRKDICCYADSE